ncbi:MAG: family 10 glycosylhydrolase [Rubrivivax sp.]|nr:family 10 glycosylhydrolase [Rubrivivax sp.]
MALLVLVLVLAWHGSGAAAPGGPAGAAVRPGAQGLPAERLLPEAELPPPAPRQFRAAWVATVANIDWPSRPGLSTREQQGEARAILERARALGLNALVLQVRPAGDALYASRLEPWSEYLTGRQGQPPRPWWDPLAFWVREAHARGLELHAWFNPFRARHPTAKTPLVKPHLALRAPHAVKPYGELLWADPGDATARAQMLAVVEDVLRRYDIDGVHIDDYFYPYPITESGSELAFPDSEAYLRYLGEGGALPLPDWRRAHVDSLVHALHEKVRAVRPRVPVGISPFGLPRPDRRPPGVSGFSQYDKLFADVERWLQEGWLDYLAPQLYWPLASENQPFVPLLQSWVQANVRGRHLWPGLFTSSVRPPAPVAGEGLGATRSWPAREVLDQLAALAREPGAGGHIHFSMVALLQDRDGLATQLQRGAYAVPALVPATPWLDDQPPPAPRLARRSDGALIEPGVGEAPARYAVWRRVDGAWRFAIHGPAERRVARDRADAVVVAAVDRNGNLSERQAVRWP